MIFRNIWESRCKALNSGGEYDALQPEYDAVRAVISARLACHMTQKELADKSGLRQSNISRIESGSASPTVDTLARIAAGLGKQLKIEFV